MPITDPIADMLTRIRNGNIAKSASVDIPASKMKIEIAKILDSEGFIKSHEVMKNNEAFDVIRVYLKYYEDDRRAITGLKRISKPGLRIYSKSRDIPKVLGGYGKAILSTSRGVLTDDNARKMGVGGEVICYVW